MHIIKKKEKDGIDITKITKICIDDFALKKRQRYGTVLIDIETGRIIDMLESREPEDVSTWLSKYPNIQIVSRDGSQTYASAIAASHPNAIQISDRFHILKNLTKKVNQKFHKLFKSRIVIPLTSKTTERKIILGTSNRASKIELVKKMHIVGRTIREISALTGIVDRTVIKYIKMPKKDIPVLKPDSREKEHINNAKKLQDKIQLVKKLKAKGLSIRDIERKTGLSRGAIRVYLLKNVIPVNGQYGKHREGKLEPYREEILKLKTEGYSYSQIYEKIQKRGYQGGQVAIRAFIARERRFRNTIQEAYGNMPIELIDKRWVLSLIYQPIEKVKGITKEQFENVVKTYPLAGTLLKMVKDFKKILKSEKPRSIYYWIKKATELNIEELNSFINGMKKDMPAILNSIKYPYNNGVAEGNVNKIKVIKRIMYGRCGFELLKQKILKLEKLQFN